MSFEDIGSVDIDYEDETFTVWRNSGKFQTYRISEERDLLRTFLDPEMDREGGKIPVFEVTPEAEEVRGTAAYRISDVVNRTNKGTFAKGHIPWNKKIR